MAKEMNSYIGISEFELQSRYYIYFWTYPLKKAMNPLYSCHLWVNYLCFSFTKVALILNNNTKVDMPLKKENEPIDIHLRQALSVRKMKSFCSNSHSPVNLALYHTLNYHRTVNLRDSEQFKFK